VRGLTPLAHFALAWPLASFPLLNLLSFCGLYFWPIGVCLAIVAAIRARVLKTNRGDWMVALPLSIAWLCLSYIYFGDWWTAYGD
jgi:hypothetical protein